MYCSLAWLIVCCLSLFSIAYSSLCLGHISDRMGGMGGPMGAPMMMGPGGGAVMMDGGMMMGGPVGVLGVFSWRPWSFIQCVSTTN